MLKIYNSLTNVIEEFKSIKEKEVLMYVCGPTVYDFPHVGNMRPPVFFDTLKKYLEFIGYKVSYASNFTDIDDKIVNKSINLGISEKELTTTFIKYYLDILSTLNCSKQDYNPRATDYVNQMIDFISKLIEKDFAYKNESGVYFRVNKIDDYGILSNQLQEFLDSGVRIELKDKEDQRDFALWKYVDNGIVFDAPFGSGRPGWHTECVVMINSLFGDYIDIHGGGSDLKFPHHENEIAQSKALQHNHLSKYFVHVGRVNAGNNVKMSKSLGNIIKANDAIDQYGSSIIRYFLISSNYRTNIVFDSDILSSINIEYEKIKKCIIKSTLQLKINNINDSLLDENLIEEFKAHMDDDINTPNVFTLIQNICKLINKTTDLLTLSKYVNTLHTILNILGIDYIPNITSEIIDTYNEWVLSRINKDYQKSDTLRNILIKENII
jgi:cysteinyl-tRNA synthetase